VIEVVRGLWGAALLATPDRVLATVHGVRMDARSRAIARILGARHLTQSVLSGCRPSPEVLAMGVWVDTVHALTAVGLAVVDRPRARAGLTDGAVAALWAASGNHALGRVPATPVAHQRIRDQLAMTVLEHVPGGRRLLTRVRHAGNAR
jgi:hypothetical protein